MRITLESTSKLVGIATRNGASQSMGRIWEGTTENGIKVTALIASLGVPADADQTAFKNELMKTEHKKPEMPQAWDLRFFID